jgi:Ca-activated chloride channel family protein
MLSLFRKLCAALAALTALGTGGLAAAQPAAPGKTDTTLSPYFTVSNAEPDVDALPLKSTRVEVAIAGVIADVRVTQVYRNEGTRPLEARYVFPASTRAAVYGLRMRIGDRAVDAEIREKQQARKDYAQAKQEGRSAALLEQHRPNVFQMHLANILPGDEISVDLRYTESIVPTDGTYRFIYPTVVGPRYNGGPSSGPGDTPGSAAFTESRKPEPWIAQPTLRAGVASPAVFSLDATITAPLPVQAIESPSHAVRATGVGTDRASVQLAADRAHANRDVVIDYRLAGASIGAGVLVHQRGDESHFLLLAEPPARVAEGDIAPREYVFVVDVSGSMHGFPLNTAKALLRELIGRLRPDDTFNVIPFAGGHSLLHAQSVPATPENIARAIRFLERQNGSGGTELLPALRTALAMPADPGRARSFLVITDGYVSIEREAFALVREQLGAANVFAFGIGASVNRFLIEGLARAGRGEPFFVLKPEQADAEALRFRRYIEQPVFTRIRTRFIGIDVYDLDTPQLPDLFAQRPILLSGKFRGAPRGRVQIEGFAGGQRTVLDVDLARAQVAGTQALPLLWARSRIAQLGDDQKLAADDARVREITQLGLSYSLLTDYTSFVAIDKLIRKVDAPATTVDQPQPLPEGVSELAVAAAPATPEPAFYALGATLGALLWTLRRRKRPTEMSRG